MIEIEMPGLSSLMDKLGDMGKRAKNLKPAFRVIDKLLESHVSRTFETEGTHGGKKWAPLRPSTVRARASGSGYYRRASLSAGPRGPVLQWTQRMRGSFKSGGRYHIRQISNRTMRWGSRHPVVDFHQTGKGRMRRQMLRFASNFQRREVIGRPVEMYIMGVPVGAIETIMKARTRS